MIKKLAIFLALFVVPFACFAYPTEVFQGTTATASSGTTISNCVDGDTATFCNQITDGDGAWFKVDLGVGVAERVTQIRLYTNDNINYAPDDYLIQGSNNDSDWTTLATIVDEKMTVNTWKTVDFTNASTYRYYRLFNLYSYAEAWVYFSEIQGYAVAPASSARRIISAM